MTAGEVTSCIGIFSRSGQLPHRDALLVVDRTENGLVELKIQEKKKDNLDETGTHASLLVIGFEEALLPEKELVPETELSWGRCQHEGLGDGDEDSGGVVGEGGVEDTAEFQTQRVGAGNRHTERSLLAAAARLAFLSNS